jgi:hypothetical protein
MGADFIGWRSCPLQSELQPEGFLGKLKLRSYKAAIEAQVPEERREGIEVVVRVTGRPERSLRYRSICDEIEAFANGIPECAACPLSGGKPLGCYRYVTYPIDAVAERLLFEFFSQQVAIEDSICAQLYAGIVSQFEDEGTGWHESRGENGSFATLDAPLVHVWGKGKNKRRVDSAQLLPALFIPLDSPEAVTVYALFWLELFAFVEARIASAGVKLGGDALEIHITAKGKRPRAAGLAKQATSALALVAEMSGSRTLEELRQVKDLLLAVQPAAVDKGWRVVVDA